MSVFSMQSLKLFASTVLFTFILDMLWLGIIAKNTYHQQLGQLLRKSNEMLAPNWTAAILVYVMIAVGIVFFVLPKTQENYLFACLWGGLFGAVTYGIYDFTNLAILANWPIKITCIDFLWGCVLCALTACFATYMQKWLTA